MPAIAGPLLHLLKKFFGSIGSSFTKSRSKISVGLDSKGAQRVPSSTTHSDVELAHHTGGISKSVEASMSMYNIPNDARSDDDVELVSRDLSDAAAQGTGRHGRVTGHEYAGPWR